MLAYFQGGHVVSHLCWWVYVGYSNYVDEAFIDFYIAEVELKIDYELNVLYGLNLYSMW